MATATTTAASVCIEANHSPENPRMPSAIIVNAASRQPPIRPASNAAAAPKAQNGRAVSAD